jgi:hypothetical protein
MPHACIFNILIAVRGVLRAALKLSGLKNTKKPVALFALASRL